MFSIQFAGTDQSYEASAALSVSEAAAQCDFLVEHPCAARGTCGKCRVRFLHGAPPATAIEEVHLESDELAGGWRLACQSFITADATIELPPRIVTGDEKSFGPEAIALDGAEPLLGPDAREDLGFAIDLGTTTLAVGLVDLRQNLLLAAASATNPQLMYGYDVISRIHFAAKRAGTASRLTAVLRDCLQSLATDLLSAAGRDSSDVGAAALCGNAFMTHSVLGLDVRTLGVAPFKGLTVQAKERPLTALGLPGSEGGLAHVFPQVGSHVGGDAVAAMLAADFARDPRRELLIDLGTNTEIVATNGERILATSAAAGPAFEGAGISCGMRATDGAVDRVSLDATGGLLVHVRGGGEAQGICGTGLVDAVAMLLDIGFVELSGRLLPRRQVSGRSNLVDRLLDKGTAHGFLLSPPQYRRIVLAASDVRQLQLVKGSIAAGIDILLQELGILPGQLEAIHVAGAFGSFLRKESALRIGLLPDVSPERIRFLGDAAAIGARLALCDRRRWQRAASLSRRTDRIELASHPAYLDHFANGMGFPR